MKLTQYTTNFLSCLAEFIIFFQFYKHFFSRKQISRKRLCVITFFVTAIMAFVNCQQIVLLNTVSILILLLFYEYHLFAGKFFTQVIITVVFTGVGVISEYVTGFAVSAFLNLQLLDTIEEPYYLFVIIAVSKLLLFLLTRLIIFLVSRKNQKYLEGNSFWAIPFPAFCIVNMYLLMYLQNDRPTNTGELLFIIFVGIGLIFSCIVIFMIYDRSMQKKELENRVQLAESREEANNALYLQQKRSIEENRALLHDFKNQLITLDLLYKAGDQNTEDYRESLLHALEEQAGSNPIDVKNAVVSNILANTKNRCAQKGILFMAEIACNDLSFLEYMDADSILNNALDNAMTACEEQPEGADKFISVKLYRASYFHVLKVCNSRANELREKTGELFTTKGDSLRHGMGLKNIRRAAEKYSGDISCQYDSESFMLVVRLKPEREKEIALVGIVV